MRLDEQYWDVLWQNKMTQWDTLCLMAIFCCVVSFVLCLHLTPALVRYAAQLEDKNIAVLIPRCGNELFFEMIKK